MRLPRSLRGRIALAAVGAVALCGVLAGGLLLAAVERDGRNQLDGELRERALSILRRPPDRGAYGHGRGTQTLLKGSGTFAQVAYGDEVVAQEGDTPDAPLDVPKHDGFETVEIAGTPWRSLTYTLAVAGSPRLQVLSSLAPVEERVGSIRRLVLLLGFSALAAHRARGLGLHRRSPSGRSRGCARAPRASPGHRTSRRRCPTRARRRCTSSPARSTRCSRASPRRPPPPSARSRRPAASPPTRAMSCARR